MVLPRFAPWSLQRCCTVTCCPPGPGGATRRPYSALGGQYQWSQSKCEEKTDPYSEHRRRYHQRFDQWRKQRESSSGSEGGSSGSGCASSGSEDCRQDFDDFLSECQWRRVNDALQFGALLTLGWTVAHPGRWEQGRPEHAAWAGQRPRCCPVKMARERRWRRNEAVLKALPEEKIKAEAKGERYPRKPAAPERDRRAWERHSALIAGLTSRLVDDIEASTADSIRRVALNQGRRWQNPESAPASATARSLPALDVIPEEARTTQPKAKASVTRQDSGISSDLSGYAVPVAAPAPMPVSPVFVEENTKVLDLGREDSLELGDEEELSVEYVAPSEKKRKRRRRESPKVAKAEPPTPPRSGDVSNLLSAQQLLHARMEANLGLDLLLSGSPANLSEGFELLNRAARSGDSEAMHNLGVVFDQGYGVPKDPARAAKWFRRSARRKAEVDALLGAAEDLDRREGRDEFGWEVRQVAAV